MYFYIIAWKISQLSSTIAENENEFIRAGKKSWTIVRERFHGRVRGTRFDSVYDFVEDWIAGISWRKKAGTRVERLETNWRLAMKLNVESCVYRALTGLPPQRMDPFSLVTPLLVSRDSWYGGRKKSIFATRYQVWSVARVARRIFPGCLRNISRG